MKTIAITIEEDMLQRLDRFVAAGETTHRNRSQIIREAVQAYVKERERQAEEEREREIFQRHRRQLAREAAALVKEQARL